MSSVRPEVVDQLVAAYARSGAGQDAVFELAAIELGQEPTDEERDEAKRRWRAMPEAERAVVRATGRAPDPRPHLRVVRSEEDDRA